MRGRDLPGRGSPLGGFPVVAWVLIWIAAALAVADAVEEPSPYVAATPTKEARSSSLAVHLVAEMHGPALQIDPMPPQPKHLAEARAGRGGDTRFHSRFQRGGRGNSRGGSRTQKARRSGLPKDGRGWFRTTDLSRVKRALSH